MELKKMEKSGVMEGRTTNETDVIVRHIKVYQRRKIVSPESSLRWVILFVRTVGETSPVGGSENVKDEVQ